MDKIKRTVCVNEFDLTFGNDSNEPPEFSIVATYTDDKSFFSYCDCVDNFEEAKQKIDAMFDEEDFNVELVYSPNALICFNVSVYDVCEDSYKKLSIDESDISISNVDIYMKYLSDLRNAENIELPIKNEFVKNNLKEAINYLKTVKLEMPLSSKDKA